MVGSLLAVSVQQHALYPQQLQMGLPAPMQLFLKRIKEPESLLWYRLSCKHVT